MPCMNFEHIVLNEKGQKQSCIIPFIESVHDRQFYRYKKKKKKVDCWMPGN